MCVVCGLREQNFCFEVKNEHLDIKKTVSMCSGSMTLDTIRNKGES